MITLQPYNQTIIATPAGDLDSTKPDGVVFSMPHESLSFFNFEDSEDRLKDISVNDSVSTETNVSFGGSGLDSNVAILNGSGFIDLSAEIARYVALDSFSFSAKIRFNTLVGTQSILSFSDSSEEARDCILYAQDDNLQFQIRTSISNLLFRYVIPTILAVDTDYTISVSTGPSGPKLWIGNTFYDPATYVDTGSPSSAASIVDVIPNVALIGANRDVSGDEYHLNASVKDVILSDEEFNQTTVDNIVNDIYGYDVFALWGQSNAIGRPSIRIGIDDDYSQVSSLVSQFGFTSQTLKAATNPLDHQDEQSGDMGMWLAMCNSLVSDVAYKRKILLVPAAKGGTGFITDDWNAGDSTYESALSSTNVAMDISKLSTLRAMHWIQGETDADNSSTTYEADLTAMQNDAYTRLNGYSIDVPFICVSILGSTIPANVSVINSALQSFVAGDTDRGYVDATDLNLFDAFHYDQASLVTIGDRSYIKITELVT